MNIKSHYSVSIFVIRHINCVCSVVRIIQFHANDLMGVIKQRLFLVTVDTFC
jgi:hypothetical protein